MLVYTATKQSFLSDVRDNAIHEKIRQEVKRRTGAGASESHIAAWRNSMQFMASILQDEGLPHDAGVSIDSFLQKPVEGAGGVPIVLVTHATPESNLLDAITRIGKLQAVLERPRLLRVARI